MSNKHLKESLQLDCYFDLEIRVQF